jgi:hypothetical protein
MSILDKILQTYKGHMGLVQHYLFRFFHELFFLLLIIEVRKARNKNILCGCNTLGAKINEIFYFYIYNCRARSPLVHHIVFLGNGEGNQKLFKKQSMYLFWKTNVCHLEK